MDKQEKCLDSLFKRKKQLQAIKKFRQRSSKRSSRPQSADDYMKSSSLLCAPQSTNTHSQHSEDNAPFTIQSSFSACAPQSVETYPQHSEDNAPLTIQSSTSACAPQSVETYPQHSEDNAPLTIQSSTSACAPQSVETYPQHSEDNAPFTIESSTSACAPQSVETYPQHSEDNALFTIESSTSACAPQSVETYPQHSEDNAPFAIESSFSACAPQSVETYPQHSEDNAPFTIESSTSACAPQSVETYPQHSEDNAPLTIQSSTSACAPQSVETYPQHSEDNAPFTIESSTSACAPQSVETYPQHSEDNAPFTIESSFSACAPQSVETYLQHSEDNAPLTIQSSTSACAPQSVETYPQHSEDNAPFTIESSTSACAPQSVETYPQHSEDNAPLTIQSSTSACAPQSVETYPQHSEDNAPFTIESSTSACAPQSVEIYEHYSEDYGSVLIQSSPSSYILQNEDTHRQQDDFFQFPSSTTAQPSTSSCTLRSDNTYLQRSDNEVTSIAAHNENSPKLRKRRKVLKKALIDFLSEDEQEPFSAGSSDEWALNESDFSSGSETKKNKRFKKKRSAENRIENDLSVKKVKRPNKYKKNKELRDAGMSYENRKGERIEKLSMQENPCIPEKCKRGCFEISEERRLSLYNFFWSLDVQRRKDWIVRSTRLVPIKRRRTESPMSKRSNTYEYYINEGEDRRKVCQKFLMNTLAIKQKYLLYTIAHSNENMAQKDQRHRTAPSKYSEATKNHVIEFVNKLPLVPSHYNIKNSNRLYLSQELRSMSNLYRIYKQDCEKEGKEIVTEGIFREIFKTNFSHVGFHAPKKDKCVTCTKAEHQNELSEEERSNLNDHILEKKATYQRFSSHQKIHAINNETVTASFDLQKVLNTPHGESMLLYYSRKYAVYNFTVYESGTQEGYCFTWGECDAKRGSNEIATCLFLYLKTLDEKGVKNLLLYCDSCSGQNKNKTVLSALNYFLMHSKNLQVIQINFLLPGHTYMPADSMHATIEREVRKLIVWSPSQWSTYFESARKRPKPYKVTVMDHLDFLNWEEVTSNTFTKETLKEIKWKELRTATFKKKSLNQMEIKSSMQENADSRTIQLFQENKRKGKGKGKGKGQSKAAEQAEENKNRYKEVMKLTLNSLYSEKLPIPKAKYDDLKRLCSNMTIPKRFHAEYEQLPYQCQTAETLIETDEDDEVDD